VIYIFFRKKINSTIIINQDEPQFPPLPDIGEHVIGKKRDKLIIKEYTIIKCRKCQTERTQPFKPGDYIFKDLPNECEKCHNKSSLSIVSIYSEFIDLKKQKL